MRRINFSTRYRPVGLKRDGISREADAIEEYKSIRNQLRHEKKCVIFKNIVLSCNAEAQRESSLWNRNPLIKSRATPNAL